MNDTVVKAAVAQFLKNVNGTAQREIEKVVRAAMESGKLQAHDSCTAGVTLTAEKIGLNITIYSKLEI